MVFSTGLSRHEQRIAELTDENATLREELRQLKDAVRVPTDTRTIDYISAFGLTMTEARVFRCLAEREYVSHDLLKRAVWGHKANPISEKMISTMVFKVRCKVEPHGICIDLIWGQGYTMSVDMKAKVRKFLEDWIAAGRKAANRNAETPPHDEADGHG